MSTVEVSRQVREQPDELTSTRIIRHLRWTINMKSVEWESHWVMEYLCFTRGTKYEKSCRVDIVTLSIKKLLDFTFRGTVKGGGSEKQWNSHEVIWGVILLAR